MTTYRHTAEMGEISGFGGDYENACQNMLEAGVKWLQENPTAEPQFRGMKGVMGLIDANNADAEALDRAIDEACDDYSSLMYHSVVGRLLWIKANSWQAYVDRLTQSNKEDA